jgi:hypothetical protein
MTTNPSPSVTRHEIIICVRETENRRKLPHTHGVGEG